LDAEQADLGREIRARLRPIGQRFRVSRRDSERLSQILLAQRKLQALGRRSKLPTTLRKKTYLLEALDLFEITRKAEEESLGPLRQWRHQALEEQKEREAERGSEEGAAPRRRRSSRRRRQRRSGRTRRPPASKGRAQARV
jgi:hypothetical protein